MLTGNYCQTQQMIYCKKIQLLHNYAPNFSYAKNKVLQFPTPET